MTEISPNYYAGGVKASEYVLRGTGFTLIPENALGLLADNNAVPLSNINSQSPASLYDIVSKTPTEIVLRQESGLALNFAVYLGGIVSADRQTVYWTNNTRPLP